MNLINLIEQINAIPDAGIVFAERIGGEFRAESQVAIVELIDNELKENIVNVAQQKATGKEYFLEVSIIKEVLDGWKKNHKDQTLNLEKILKTITYYAEKDAYPESFYR